MTREHAPDQATFEVHMDHAERVAEQMEGAVLALRSELRRGRQ